MNVYYIVTLLLSISVTSDPLEKDVVDAGVVTVGLVGM